MTAIRRAFKIMSIITMIYEFLRTNSFLFLLCCAENVCVAIDDWRRIAVAKLSLPYHIDCQSTEFGASSFCCAFHFLRTPRAHVDSFLYTAKRITADCRAFTTVDFCESTLISNINQRHNRCLQFEPTSCPPPFIKNDLLKILTPFLIAFQRFAPERVPAQNPFNLQRELHHNIEQSEISRQIPSPAANIFYIHRHV